MILKKLKRAKFTKTKATMIAALVDYIFAKTDGQGRDKLAYFGSRNFITGTLAAQKNEMIALAEESIQSKMPVAHWIMSFQENEMPSHEQIDEAVDIFLERMGLREHQTLYVLHGNTGNFHIHIAVNRTHPYTMKTIQPHRGFDIEEGHRIAAVIEHTQGWASQTRARYRINEQGEVVRNHWKPDIKPKQKAEEFESATGEKSAQRIAQERGHAVIKNASSWAELHQGMAMAGLRLEKKGSGAIVFAGETAVKASSIDRNFGLSKLCKRLGEFEAGEYPPEAEDMPTIEPEPVSDVFTKEWQEYRQARADEAARQHNVRRHIAADMRRIREQQRQQRRESLAALAPHGLPMLNIARHFLKEQQQTEKKQVLEKMPTMQQRRPVGSFRQWLGRKSRLLANLWRFRRRITPDLEVRKFAFPKIGNLSEPYTAYRAVVKKRFPEKLDESRLDALIALYMRCAGYEYQDIGQAMFQGAKPLRQEQEHRDWKDYAQRIINYSFGTPGNIEIAAFSPTPEMIQKLHKEAQEIEATRLNKAQQQEQQQYRMRMR
jgi:hypothetical protein